MTVTEIRKAIRQSEHKAWYNSLEIHLEFEFANFEIDLVGFDTIFQFFKNQLDFFEKNEPLPQTLQPSKRYFNHCKNKIENFTIVNIINQRSNRAGDWAILKKELTNTGNINERYFNRESSTTDFLLKLDSEYIGASKGAFDFLTNKSFNYNISDKNYFIGWHRAYEFFTQDADSVKRRNNERQTLSRIRSEYIKNLEQNDKNVSEHIAEKEKFYTDKEKAISRLIKKKNNEFLKWEEDKKAEYESLITDSDVAFQKQLEDSDKAFKELEKLYTEKLKLEAPAQYWKDRSAKLRKEGDQWLYWLIGVTIVAVLALGAVLYFISDGTLKDLFEKTGSAIRWSIVFVTFVSFLAYGIRTFAKLMFSAYHLHRDAEEREQLSYVYLALKKEQNIDETERHLIMQSLFSRADSGLLRDDSSPTMPGGSIVEKMFGGK